VEDRHDRWQDAMLLALAWTAGYLDAVSFFALGGVFTAIMTGNTVFLGVAFGRGDALAAARSGTALAGFALGVALGALIARRGGSRRGWSAAVTALVAIECTALVALAAAWQLLGPGTPGRPYALIFAAAVAMGLQSLAVRRVGIPDVATTYVTGSLTGALERLVHGGGSGATYRGAAEAAGAGRTWRLPAAVWGLSGLGAAIGGTAIRHLRGGVIWPAVAVVLAVVAAALARGDGGRPARPVSEDEGSEG
jgi:uncharacterized membrane protein YoaK (UPF0700 family)